MDRGLITVLGLEGERESSNILRSLKAFFGKLLRTVKITKRQKIPKLNKISRERKEKGSKGEEPKKLSKALKFINKKGEQEREETLFSR